MTTTYKQRGETLTYSNTSSAAIAAGAVVAVGDRIGIAVADIAATSGVGELSMVGVHALTKDTGTANAWSAGADLFWDTSALKLYPTPGATRIAAGVAWAAALAADTTADVKIGGISIAQATTTVYGAVLKAAVDADITDSTTGTPGNGLAAMTNTTNLTDSGGGTADGTVAAQAAPVTLTDSSGYDATHNDTIAATAAITTITDSSGLDGSHDDTIAAITNMATLTNSTGGSADATLDAVTQASGSAAVSFTDGDAAKINNNFTEIKTELDKQVTANGVLAQNQSDLGQKLIELVGREVVHAQNVSDIAQKIIELVTLAGVAQANLKEVTTELATQRTLNGKLVDAVAALAAEINDLKAKMRTAGQLASA